MRGPTHPRLVPTGPSDSVKPPPDLDRNPYNHIVTHMKTTIELPDDLFADAKVTAARRRTTLKAMIEHALRRELYRDEQVRDSSDSFTIDEHGLPLFKKRDGSVVTSEMVYEMMEDLGV
jgi:predicted transcriptional regulator